MLKKNWTVSPSNTEYETIDLIDPVLDKVVTLISASITHVLE